VDSTPRIPLNIRWMCELKSEFFLIAYQSIPKQPAMTTESDSAKESSMRANRSTTAKAIWEMIQKKFHVLVSQLTPILDKIRDGEMDSGCLMGILGKVQSSKSLSICIMVWFAQFISEYDFDISIIVFNLLNCKSDLEWKMNNCIFSDCIENAIDECELTHISSQTRTELIDWFSIGSKSGKGNSVNIYLGNVVQIKRMQKNVMQNNRKNLVIIDEIHSIFTPANKKVDNTLDTLRDWIDKKQAMVVGVSATWERVFLNEEFSELIKHSIICEITPHIPDGFRYMDIEDVDYSNEVTQMWSYDWVFRCVIAEMKRLESTEFIPMICVLAKTLREQEDLRRLLGQTWGVFPVVVNQNSSLVSAFIEIQSAADAGKRMNCVVIIGEGSIGISVSIRPPKPIVIGNKTLFALTAMVSKSLSKQANTESVIQSRGRILGLVPSNFPHACIYTYNDSMVKEIKDHIKSNDIVNGSYTSPTSMVTIPTKNPLYPNEVYETQSMHDIDFSGESVRKVFFGKNRDKEYVACAATRTSCAAHDADSSDKRTNRQKECAQQLQSRTGVSRLLKHFISYGKMTLHTFKTCCEIISGIRYTEGFFATGEHSQFGPILIKRYEMVDIHPDYLLARHS
jgi:hypothetical protein